MSIAHINILHCMTSRYRAALPACALVVAAASSEPGIAADWKPEKNVEIVAMSGPGGANDIIARTVQGIMQQKKLVEVPITVVSKSATWKIISRKVIS